MARFCVPDVGALELCGLLYCVFNVGKRIMAGQNTPCPRYAIRSKLHIAAAADINFHLVIYIYIYIYIIANHFEFI